MSSNLGNKEIFSKNLKRQMDRRNKDRNQICDDLDIKYSTFSEWYNGNKYPRIDKIEKLANYFGVKKSDLIEDQSAKVEAPYNPTHRIPILGRISAGLPLYADQHIEGYTYVELNGANEYFALRVYGDSMSAARICDGDLLIVRRQSQVDNGAIAVVIVDGENATVKKFSQNGNIVTLVPCSHNPVHQVQVYDMSEVEIKIIGLVVKNEISY